jgi:hypothetical protein
MMDIVLFALPPMSLFIRTFVYSFRLFNMTRFVKSEAFTEMLMKVEGVIVVDFSWESVASI